MPYGQWNTVPLSVVVKGARCGCVEAMEELPNRLVYEYSPDIVDALLFHMKSRLPKKHWNELDLAIWRNTDLCALALRTIAHILEICPPSTSHAEATIKQVSSRMSDLVYTAFCIMRRVVDPKTSKIRFDALVPAEDIAKTAIISIIFEGFASLHEPLRKPMLKFDDVLDLSLLFWVATIDGDPFVYPMGPSDVYRQTIDPAISLFKYALESNARGIAAAIIRENVCTPEAFAQATIRRMKSWLNLNTLKHLRFLKGQTRQDPPITYCVHIAEMLMGAHPAIFRLMIEHRVPEVFMHVLVELDTGNCRDSKNHLKPCAAMLTVLSMDVLDLATVVIRWTEDSSFQHAVASAKRLMMAKCVLQLLRNCVTRRVPMAKGLAKKESDVVHDMFQILFRFSMYPKTSMAFFILCATVCETDSRFHRPEMRDLRKVIFKFTTLVTTRIPKDIVSGRVKLCDNLEHRHLDKRDGAFVLQKTCAKCHSVVYCSAECQAQDWEARHSRECHAMYMDYLGSIQLLGTRARGYHLTILRHVYANEVKKLGIPLSGNFIVKLDAADIAKPFSLEELDGYINVTNGFLEAWKRRWSRLKPCGKGSPIKRWSSIDSTSSMESSGLVARSSTLWCFYTGNRVHNRRSL